MEHDLGRAHAQGAIATAAHEVEGGSVSQAVGGAAAMVLGVLGLVGLDPPLLASVAAIAAGVALFVGGGLIASRYNRLVLAYETRHQRREIVGGLGMEAFAGIAGVVLGILALLSIDALTLLAVAAIVLGAGLVMSAASMTRLEQLLRREELIDEHRVAQETMYVASGSEVFVGFGVIALGILALAGVAPLTLSLIAMLSVGAVVLLSGSSVAGRVFALFH